MVFAYIKYEKTRRTCGSLFGFVEVQLGYTATRAAWQVTYHQKQDEQKEPDYSPEYKGEVRTERNPWLLTDKEP